MNTSSFPADWPWISIQVKNENGEDIALVEFDKIFGTIGQVWFASGYTVVGYEPGKDATLWC